MEPQAEYKIKERQFHGDYFSPSNGRRPNQYKASAIIFFCSCLVLLAIIFVAGIVLLTNWVIQLIQTL